MSRFMNRSPGQAANGPGSANSGDSGFGGDQPKQSSSFTRHFRTSSTSSSSATSGIFGRSPISPSFPANAQQFNPIAFPSPNPNPSKPFQGSPNLPVVSLIPPRDQALSLDSHRTDMPSFFHLPGRRSTKDKTTPTTSEIPTTINLNLTDPAPGPIGRASVGMEKTRSKSPPSAEASATVKRFHTLSSDHPPARLQSRNQAQPLVSPEMKEELRSDRSPDPSEAISLQPSGLIGETPLMRRLGPGRSLPHPITRQRYLGSSLEGSDTFAGDDMSEALEEYRETIDAQAIKGGDAGVVSQNNPLQSGISGLYRQTSLPNRGPIIANPVLHHTNSATSVSRKSSRSSQHPSIAEDGPATTAGPHGLVSTYSSSLTNPVIGSGTSSMSGGRTGNSRYAHTSPILGGDPGLRRAGSISRTNSMRQAGDVVDLSAELTNDSEPSLHHHRSYSHNTTTGYSRPSPGAIGRASSPPEAGSLHKSNSLRATLANGFTQHNSNTGGSLTDAGTKLTHSTSIGHAHNRSMYALSDTPVDPPLSANAALTPTNAAMWDKAPASPGRGETAAGRQPQVDVDGVRRAHSLNQNSNHGDRARDKQTAPQSTRKDKDFNPMDPWKERTSVDDDGWAEFEQLRNGQVELDIHVPSSRAGATAPQVEADQTEGAYQMRLRQAFEAMQLGTQMMQSNPDAGRGVISAPNPSGLGAFEAPIGSGLPGPIPRQTFGSRSGGGSQGGMSAEQSALAYNNLLQQQVAQQQEQLHQQQQMLLAASGMLQQYSPMSFGNPMQLGNTPGAPSTFMTAGAAGILPSSMWSMNPQQPSVPLGGGLNMGQMQSSLPGFGGPNHRSMPPGQPQNGFNRFNGQQPPHRGLNNGVPALSLPTSAQRAAASARRPDYRPEVARAAEKEVRELVESRGLNPLDFDCAPQRARFFVIKSFTEDDVQKSLKHEIWSSTTFGNKRLDSAFQESTGPVFLFFSVNGSGHFCGVAEMLTRVDYNKSADVWAQDGKWKGVFNLKWVFVKDIPNGVLRHIRLTNTTEQKPITNSRDTQELTYDAGVEVLRIFLAYRQKTSLLEDFGYYEMQSANKAVSPAATGNTSPAAIPAGSAGESPAPALQEETTPPLTASITVDAPVPPAEPAQTQAVAPPPVVPSYSSAVNPSAARPPVALNGGFSAEVTGPVIGQGPKPGQQAASGPVPPQPPLKVGGAQGQGQGQGPPQSQVQSGFGKPPGFSKGFNASGPPSLSSNGRFAVIGGSKNGVSGGVRGTHGR